MFFHWRKIGNFPLMDSMKFWWMNYCYLKMVYMDYNHIEGCLISSHNLWFFKCQINLNFMGIWMPKVKLHESFWHVFDLFDTINQMTLNIRRIVKIGYLILHLRCILRCVDVYNVTYFSKYLFITHGSLLRICKCAFFLFNSKVSVMVPIILLGSVQF